MGDAQSVVVPDGTLMIANCCSFPFFAALFDEKDTDLDYDRRQPTRLLRRGQDGRYFPMERY